MNETSNMNSISTGGVCSSCLKEMPLVTSSNNVNNNSLTKLCSNCINEFVDQQQISSDLNKKYPFVPASQTMINLPTNSQLNSQAMSSNPSMVTSHFSSLPSSSASSTSSSISSSHRRFSGFDPFLSIHPNSNSLMANFNDFNGNYSNFPLNNRSNLLETNPTNANSPTTNTTISNDFFRNFHQIFNGTTNGGRDSPGNSNSLPNNDLSSNFLSSSSPFVQGNFPLSNNRSSSNDVPSSFCCFANNPPYTYCVDCESSLCEKCALIHPKILGFKNHRQQLLSSSMFNMNSPSRSVRSNSSASSELLPIGTNNNPRKFA